MIQVTITHRNQIELIRSMTVAIDPEKIVSTRDREGVCEIEYGETFDRRRQPIVYRLTDDRDTINALITGTYETKMLLNLDVYDLTSGETFDMDLQEKYVVDIRESVQTIGGVRTACRRIEYIPGAFVPKIIFVEEAINDLITNATTTTSEETTTTEEVTTTAEATTEEVTTTIEPTTEEPTTTDEVTTTIE